MLMNSKTGVALSKVLEETYLCMIFLACFQIFEETSEDGYYEKG